MLILVYAGANGTGKSTLFTFLKEELDLPFINSDMIAKDYFYNSFLLIRYLRLNKYFPAVTIR